jgi:Leucine-rich repeat (LRR) protein
MLNASFCKVDEITGGQAVVLQHRSMMLRDNPIIELDWKYQGGLTGVPAWVRTLEGLTYANLEFCGVQELKKGDFPPSLAGLRVDHQQGNGLRLHEDSFEGLTRLHTLDISFNYLTNEDMHPGLFAENNALSTLYVGGNTDLTKFNATELFSANSMLWQLEMFQELPGVGGLTGVGGDSGTTFKGLNNLRTLHLEKNMIAVLHEDAFDDTDPMKIKLNENQLTTIEVGAFSSEKGMWEIDLYDNKLTTLPEGVFENVKGGIDKLILSKNPIEHLPEGAFRGLAMPNANVGLGIATYSRPDDWVTVFDDVPKCYFGLSNTSLVSRLPTSRPPFPPSRAANSPCSQTHLPEGIFDGLENVTHLEMWNNQLTSFPDGVFSEMKNLVEVNFDGNELTEVQEDLLENSPLLRVVFFQHNKLTSVPAGLFQHNPELDWVRFGNNPLVELPSGLLHGRRKLTEAWFDDAELTTLPPDFFPAGELTLTSGSARLLALTPPSPLLRAAPPRAVVLSGQPHDVAASKALLEPEAPGGAGDGRHQRDRVRQRHAGGHKLRRLLPRQNIVRSRARFL